MTIFFKNVQLDYKTRRYFYLYLTITFSTDYRLNIVILSTLSLESTRYVFTYLISMFDR